MDEISSSYIPTITAIVPPDIPGMVMVEPIHKALRITFNCIRKPPYIIVHRSIVSYYIGGLYFLLKVCKIIK